MEVLEKSVGGSRVAVEAEEKLGVPDPATGELLGQVPLLSAADVDRAVKAANEAFEEWREEPVTRRARRMFCLQILLEEAHLDELYELAARENGKHIEESEAEMRPEPGEKTQYDRVRSTASSSPPSWPRRTSWTSPPPGSS